MCIRDRGNAALKVQITERDPYFYGYIVVTAVNGQAASYVLQTPAGAPLAGYSGVLGVIGPLYLKPSEYKVLVIANGPTKAQITGMLVGDKHEDPSQLVVRPIPTAAGANTSILTTLSNLTVTGPTVGNSLTALTSTSSPWANPTPAEGIAGQIFDRGGEVYNIKHPKYAAPGQSLESTAQINLAIADIKAAGRGILLAPPDVYTICTGNVTVDFTGCANLTFYAVGARFVLPALGAGQMYGFTFSNNSQVLLYGGELYSPYTVDQWNLLFMGAGTFSDLKVVRWWLHGDFTNGAHGQPYMVNMSPTANGGITDVTFDYCRFESPGNATIQVSGISIKGYTGLKVQSCTFVNINNPLVPDSTFQKQGLDYCDNWEFITNATNPVEGPDVMMVDGVSYVGNTQVVTAAITGASDVGGVLLDFGCDGASIVGNHFRGNGIVLSPSAGHPVTNFTITGNTINCSHTVANFNNAIGLLADPGAASGHGYIHGNACSGTFSGVPIFVGAGYTDLNIKDNPGDSTATAQTVTVAASQTTASNVYGDLATVGPSVTVVVGGSGIVKITLTGGLWCDNAGNTAIMGFVASGANAIGAADATALQTPAYVAGDPQQCSAVYLLTGLTPGSTTFKAQYRSATNTQNANFRNRSIIAECR